MTASSANSSNVLSRRHLPNITDEVLDVMPAGAVLPLAAISNAADLVVETDLR